MPKKESKKYLLSLLVATLLSACASPQHQALNKIDVGMVKADVLDIVGSPTRKARALGQDRWTYESEGARGPNITYVFFQDGKVTYVGGAEDPVGDLDKKNTPTKSTSKFKTIGE